MDTAIVADDFLLRLERLRAAGVLRLDLTDGDPARCGLRWDDRALAALLGPAGASGAAAPGEVRAAQEAVASYLAGHRVSVQPDQVFFAPSRSAAGRLALAAACDREGEVLVPAPASPFLEPVDVPPALRLRPYALEFGEEWRLDRRSLRKAAGPAVRAVFVGNPAEPTGAMLSGEELASLDELCGVRGAALVGDEAFLDTAFGPSTSVARATRCLAVHVSGLAGICGLPGLGGEWVALAGPEPLVAPAAARLRALADTAPAVPGATLRALPALLARREPFLEALRARLGRNRGALASASLREAPWTLQWGGGIRAVLQINPFREDTDVCLELLDEGIAVEPGHRYGFPRRGSLVLSLLPEPARFLQGIDRLEAHLRDAGGGR